MIDNVWHLRGSAKLPPSASNQEIIERIETLLSSQHKSITAQSDSSIEFSSPLWEDWSTPNWLALVIYDEGRFRVERGLEGGILRYDLRSLHGLVFCLAAAFMFFTFVSLVENVAAGGRFALLAFAWLYGANMVLAWARVPIVIKKAVNGS